MEITAIEPRRKNLSQLYIDGEPAVKLDSFLVLQRQLKPGMDISDEELYELIQASDERRAREKALYLLEHRSHSKKELAEKIARTASSRAAADAAADRMEELGLVDDRAYAENFARMLVNRKQYGLGRVRQELKFKGISSEIIEEILAEYADRDCVQAISEFLQKKYPDYAEEEAVKRRAVAALQRRGYRFDDIMRAIRETG